MSLSHPLPRELTRPVHVGGVQIGGGAPVVVQSMTCTDTADAQATLAQVCALAQAGCDIVRVSVPTEAALEGFRIICAESPVPIVADIHFNHKLAIGAVEAGAAKLRINPGNIGDWAKVDAVIDAAGAAGCAIRIGVNAGSLEQDIAERHDLTQPEKLVMSSERFVKHFEDRGFTNIVLSAKAHSVQTTLDTYRALSREIPHVPLHLGVTEAGTLFDGAVKSAMGLGIMLHATDQKRLMRANHEDFPLLFPLPNLLQGPIIDCRTPFQRLRKGRIFPICKVFRMQMALFFHIPVVLCQHNHAS